VKRAVYDLEVLLRGHAAARTGSALLSSSTPAMQGPRRTTAGREHGSAHGKRAGHADHPHGREAARETASYPEQVIPLEEDELLEL
jgi:hypothetical protein